jgi:hypothetical protein
VDAITGKVVGGQLIEHNGIGEILMKIRGQLSSKIHEQLTLYESPCGHLLFIEGSHDSVSENLMSMGGVWLPERNGWIFNADHSKSDLLKTFEIDSGEIMRDTYQFNFVESISSI